MSLTSALSTAQSALLTTSRQTSTVSKNVAEASNPDYTRRIATVTSTSPGSRAIVIQRATNELLFRHNLSALSSSSGQQALYSGMERLGLSVNGVDNAASASTAIGRLQEALHLYATSPSNRTLADSAVDAARQVVRSLNGGTASIQAFRTETDGEIAGAVQQLNGLLAEFKDANDAIVSGMRGGRDVSDSLDKRDGLLKQISEFVPISSFTRGQGDMVLTTADGATLFETVPRAVTFTASAGYSAGVAGNAVFIDGIPLAAERDASGKLAGMVQLRDSVASTLQSQLDEIARGVIEAFAETDPTGGALPKAPGLFTWPGAPAMPAVGTLLDGLAGTIRVNAAMDPSLGGNANLLRDGGANGAGYVANTGGGASYASLLIAYSERLDQPRPFDTAAGIAADSSVSSYSTSSIGWFEALRQQASRTAETKQALVIRTTEALSNATGVNVDAEMSLLLDLEHSYEASARLIKAVDDMMATLLAAVG